MRSYRAVGISQVSGVHCGKIPFTMKSFSLFFNTKVLKSAVKE